MSTIIYLLTLCLPLATVLVVFGMKYVSTVTAARARQAGDVAYRVLAEKAVAAQTENQATLTAVQRELAQLATSVAAIERILKQVG